MGVKVATSTHKSKVQVLSKATKFKTNQKQIKMNEFYDASEIRQAITPQIEQIIKDTFPAAKKKGADYRIGSIDGDPGESMSISCSGEGFGKWQDFSTGEKGDIIDIIKITQGVEYKSALKYLAQKYTSLKPVASLLKDSRKQVFKTVDPREYLAPLSLNLIKYAKEERDISEPTLRRYKVCSTKSDPENEIAFVSANEKNIPTRIHMVPVGTKNFRTNPDPMSPLWGANVATPDLCNGTLIITEGQWDAMSYAEAGMLAVSIPSGVSNMKWIEEEYEYLQQFHTFLLSFDMDDAGKKALDTAVKRLGVHKCKVIKLPLKDANEVIVNMTHDDLLASVKDAQPCDVNEIVSVQTVREETWEVLSKDRNLLGDPFFITNLKYRIREHECTIFFGHTGHGKSNVVQNQIAYDAMHGRATMIGSFEQKISFTLAAVASAYANTGKFISREHFDEVMDSLNEQVMFFDNKFGKPKSKDLVEAFIYAYKRYGVKRFVIDNIMTMDVDRSDNSNQAANADRLRLFVEEYPVNLAVVAHPRKNPEQGYPKPPHESDIMGASEWGNMAQNIITVWRNKQKEDNISELIDNNATEESILTVRRSVEDTKVMIRKQRCTGATDSKKQWFIADSKRLVSSFCDSGEFDIEEQ